MYIYLEAVPIVSSSSLENFASPEDAAWLKFILSRAVARTYCIYL